MNEDYQEGYDNLLTILIAQRDDLRAALYTILDAVDYRAGNCRPNEMVGAVLDERLLATVRNVLERTDPQ